jgi:hypothetical protein
MTTFHPGEPVNIISLSNGIFYRTRGVISHQMKSQGAVYKVRYNGGWARVHANLLEPVDVVLRLAEVKT